MGIKFWSVLFGIGFLLLYACIYIGILVDFADNYRQVSKRRKGERVSGGGFYLHIGNIVFGSFSAVGMISMGYLLSVPWYCYFACGCMMLLLVIFYLMNNRLAAEQTKIWDEKCRKEEEKFQREQAAPKLYGSELPFYDSRD